jgi:hypothetical protein
VPAYLDKLHTALVQVGFGDTSRDAFRLVVTGSRHAEHDVWVPVLHRCLRMIRARQWPRQVRVAQGGSGCIDGAARRLAREMRLQYPPAYLPNWDLGRRAGPARNRFMLDTERPDLVLGIVAYYPSPGTVDCLAAAEERRLPWVKITAEDLVMPHVDLVDVDPV